uniref:Uncharacterized protein n=1 Tax=Maylandia zebra TaxID=106582 RepID=A0A3P9CU27_9CICH
MLAAVCTCFPSGLTHGSGCNQVFSPGCQRVCLSIIKGQSGSVVHHSSISCFYLRPHNDRQGSYLRLAWKTFPSSCCMLCFGQSAFFRFNHPEEAFRMKSMMPQGGSVSAGDYRLCADTESLVNGNHQPSAAQCPPAPGEKVQSEHSAIVSSIERDLQEIMDSLVMDDPQPSSSDAMKPPGGQSAAHSPLSPMVNGGGRYLLSPPTSPGAMSVGLQLQMYKAYVIV